MAVKTTINKNLVFQSLQDHAEDIKAFKVSRLGLFGSMVRGEETEESDIDILVEYNEGHKTYHNFIKLAFFLEDILQKKVDLVTKKAVAEWMLPDIEKEIQYVEFNH